jgi:hypothetical protein
MNRHRCQKRFAYQRDMRTRYRDCPHWADGWHPWARQWRCWTHMSGRVRALVNAQRRKWEEAQERTTA